MGDMRIAANKVLVVVTLTPGKGLAGRGTGKVKAAVATPKRLRIRGGLGARLTRGQHEAKSAVATMATSVVMLFATSVVMLLVMFEMLVAAGV